MMFNTGFTTGVYTVGVKSLIFNTGYTSGVKNNFFSTDFGKAGVKTMYLKSDVKVSPC